MKTLYLTGSNSNIVVDPEIDFVGTLPCEDRYDIRSIYYIEEPTHVVYQCGERKEEIDARKGDILLVFYDNNRTKYVLDTIKTKQWAANIKLAHKIEQQAKEEWAARNAEIGCDCCECCKQCDCCSNLTATPAVEEKTTLTGKLKKLVKKIKKSNK